MQQNLAQGETIRKEAKTMWYMNKIQAFAGILAVTDNRLIFDQDPLPVVAGGLLGRLIGSQSKRNRGGVMVDVAFDRIERVERGKMGKASMLEVHETGVEKPHRFLVDDFEEWAALLLKQPA